MHDPPLLERLGALATRPFSGMVYRATRRRHLIPPGYCPPGGPALLSSRRAGARLRAQAGGPAGGGHMSFGVKTRRAIALTALALFGVLGPVGARARVISSDANGFLIENSAVVPVDA